MLQSVLNNPEAKQLLRKRTEKKRDFDIQYHLELDSGRLGSFRVPQIV